MGVTGLWQVLQPCARPIKLETLNRKRLAVDASIWIYQFLKAVRDKEGNALRNSHVVGFFRRICKLLFFGIKPVFVFDGGAPALKRQTIRARKARREGRREDAVRTAGKLLAVQMQRRVEDEEARRKAERDHAPAQEEEAVPDEGLVYVDELQMTQQERQQNRKFKKKDQYHLPDLEMSLSEMGGPNDLRIMSLEELQAYARQFDTGEDINVYDFSKIDYDSPFFQSLPPSDRYNILNAARLRSRLRMGYSKEQLDSMFPDRMAFSKFQIERVRERNELTQRLMHLEGFENTEFGAGGRIAGEKGREYVLVRNDGVEGGWALGVISEEGREDKPIDVDRPAPIIRPDAEGTSEGDDEFEDIPIEGLNRLPKEPTRNEEAANELLEQRRAVYRSRKKISTQRRKHKSTQEPASLFVQSSEDEDEGEEEVDAGNELFGESLEEDSEDELRRAIAMSMQQDPAETSTTPSTSHNGDADILECFQQTAVEEQRPLPKGSGRAIANIVNKRAFDSAPESREITSFGVPTQKPDESDDDGGGIDLQAALAESRKSKRKTSPPRQRPPVSNPDNAASRIAKQAGFNGPLPFEKLDLGSSLLGKKKMREYTQEAAGGFENPLMASKEQNKAAEPLPPWFSGDLEEDMRAQKAIEEEDRRKARDFDNGQFQFQERGEDTLRRADTNEVIDLESDEFDRGYQDGEFVDLEAEDSHEHAAAATSPIDEDLTMEEVADELHAEPSIAISLDQLKADGNDTKTSTRDSKEDNVLPLGRPTDNPLIDTNLEVSTEDDEKIEWSESDRGEDHGQQRELPEPFQGSSQIHTTPDHQPPTIIEQTKARSPSEDIEFEDVSMLNPPTSNVNHETEAIASAPDLVDQGLGLVDDDEFDDFSDPEEAEMVRNLTLEAEEHARFASSLNNKPQAQNAQEYELELKQLRNQQKKDRRDADEVTQIMIQECQALLRLFGLPYVTAPMEAEAQCAEMVQLGLVDGIVTDDSDCFLFGGTRIYKNMFNQGKFVECYLTTDLEREFGLTRKKLISLAHLLGSDYTDGVPGVGHVTATEIISEFSTLEEFKTWYSAVQMNQVTKEDDAKSPFRKKFRKNAPKLFLPTSFPDVRVDLAYENPEVDSDPEAFQWGVPDLESLRSFLMSTIGWSQERTDEVLVPVIKDMNRRADEGTQANITAFFDGTVGIGAAGNSNLTRGEGFAPRKKVEGSKRMGSALTRMAERAKQQRIGAVGGVADDVAMAEISDSGKSPSAVPKKRKTAGNARSSALSHDFHADAEEDNESDFKDEQRKQQPKKRTTNRRGKKSVAVDD